MLPLIGYFAAVFMGLSLGLIGGGGSILTVPILVYLFGMNPVLATAHSLFIVGITALVGGLSYLKKGEVDLKTGVIFAVPSFIGVYLTRAYVIPKLPDPVFSFLNIDISKSLFIMFVFSVLMLMASTSMIRSKKADTKPLSLSPAKRSLLIGTEGLIVGAVTGFVGAGGGFLIIPALVALVGLPMRIAVGTSLFIIATKSLFGFIGDVQQGVALDWTLMFSLSVIAIGGLLVGVKFSKRVSEKALKKGFGYFVLTVGLIIILDQLRTFLSLV